jgi:hypothetical protein
MRDRGAAQPFNQRTDTGRMGFRRDFEPMDDRPLLVEDACQCAGCRKHAGFWRSQTERLTYEDAVEANQRKPGETPFAYIVRISEYAVARLKSERASGLPRGTEVL